MRTRWGDEVTERTTAHSVGGAAFLTGPDDRGTHTAWALATGAPQLGAFLALAHRHEVDHLHVCTDAAVEQAADKARQAAAFNIGVTSWAVDGTELREVAPVALTAEPAPPQAVLDLGARLVEAGAEVVVEEGILRAEVLGLEVARVVTDPDTGTAVIEVGVGRHDREARAMLDASLTAEQSLSSVIETVRALRRPEVMAHPANQLAPERWLRSVLVADPSIVGAASLVPLPSPLPRPNLRVPAPAPAAGTDAHGRPVVVVCSVGVDPELVPLAADARTAASLCGYGDVGGMRLLLVVPQPDDYRVTRTLAALLRHPGEVVTVPGDWRTRSPR